MLIELELTGIIKIDFSDLGQGTTPPLSQNQDCPLHGFYGNSF